MALLELLHGDCRAVMAGLPAASVDAVVCDPPYGLSFMGKDWDHGVPGVAFWSAALRVAKPGAHLLAFGGTRTFHRLAVAIEDAGWEIRDTVMWVYGSGFPKSHNVGKGIDKLDAVDEQQARRYRFTKWVQAQGVTAKQINATLDASDMGRHYTDVPPNGNQPAIMTREHLEACRHLFNSVPEWVEREADIRSVESKNFAEREVVGQKTSGIANKDEGPRHTIGASKSVTVDITAPATDAARQWDGWGTALKPAWEPIIVARKPLSEPTVASNVLKWGVGGLNIDGCRVPANWKEERPESWFNSGKSKGGKPTYGGNLKTITDSTVGERLNAAGRWPANLIHDGSDEVLAGFPQTTSGGGDKRGGCEFFMGGDARTEPTNHEPNTGSAARFFYCAKASRADRNDGLLNPGARRKRNDTTGGKYGEAPNPKTSNHHPTVKPTALMRYLCKLVTPPAGTVLDPFMGSGSTGKAARMDGFGFIGIEQDAEYIAIARARIAHAVQSPAQQPLHI